MTLKGEATKKKIGARRQSLNTYFIVVKLIAQMYTIFLISNTPETKLFSFIEFKKHQNGKIKDYVLHLLQAYPDGLACRHISEISGIEVQSSTYPLKDLQDANLIHVTGIRKSDVSNRMVQVYSVLKVTE